MAYFYWTKKASNISCRTISFQKDLFTRTLLWGALFDSMHIAELDPTGTSKKH